MATNSTTSTTAKVTTLVIPDSPKVTPRVWYLPHVWNQLQYIIQASPKEVGWWGMVEQVGDDYCITQLYVPKQVVTGTETDISADAMADLAMEIINAGGDPAKLYYWGHSHVNMGVGPSGQDETQVRDYLQNCPVFIRGIYNKSGNSKVDIYDVEKNLCFETVKNEPAYPQLSDEDKKKLDALLKANVSEPPPPATTYQRYGGYNHGNFTNRNTGTKPNEKKNLSGDELDDDQWWAARRATNEAAKKQNTSKLSTNGCFYLVGEKAAEFYDSLTVTDLGFLQEHLYQ